MRKIGNQLWKVLCVFITLAVCLQGLPPVQPAQAATCTVTNDDDSGEGTLRALLADTNCSTIDFGENYIVRLASEVEITREVTIDGANRTVSISGDSDNNGSNDVRLFSVASGATLTLRNLTLKRADGTDGGAIANRGTLVVVNSTFTSNTASGYGGAIYNIGTLTVTGSAFIANTAAQRGGAISNGGWDIYEHLYTGVTATITNSTFTENSANQGGAIHNLSNNLLLVNNTLVNNTAYELMSVAIDNDIGVTTLINNLFMNHFPPQQTCSYDDVLSSYGGSTNNLIDYTGFAGSCPAEQVAEETLLLSSLGNYGSSTQTFALLPGSVAIDHGSSADCPATDQRGLPRVGPCDVGAYEAQGFELEPLSGATPQTVFIGAALSPLAMAVNPVNSGDPVDGGKVTYTAPVPSSGATVRTIMDYAISEEYHQVTQTISGGVSSVPAQANMTLGPYDVVASTNGAADTAFSITQTCIPGPKLVTNANDSGPGSLRDAIDSSCTDEQTVITFDNDYTILLASPLELNREYTIDGAGHKVTISGNHVTRIFNIYYVDTLLQNLTVADGVNNLPYGNGGGIFFRGFDASTGAHHTLTLTNMTFSGNRGGDGGAIFTEDNTVVTNVTFVGNEATYGAAINVDNLNIEITITNSTFKDNIGAAAGIYYGGIQDGEMTLTINNSILANGAEGSSNCSMNLWIPVQGSHNLADDFTCNGIPWNIDIDESWYPYLPPEEQYPHTSLLGELGDNGGSTQTVSLLEGSPAIDAGDDSLCPAADQRGVNRPQGAACDIGAYELEEAVIPSDYVISGVVYDDLNANGSRDAGEVGIEQAPVILALNLDQIPFNYLTAWSTADGSFQFNLTPPAGGIPAGFSVSVYVEPVAGINITQLPAPFAALTGNLTGMDIGVHTIVLTPTPAGFPDGVQGVNYNQTIAVTGGDAPYYFTPSSWPLPAGLSYAFDEPLGTITLSGTPAETGEFLAHIDFTDANGAFAQVHEYFTIHPPMQFSPATLPDGSLGTAYNQAITVSGGVPPYAFVMGSEQWIPAGMTLDTSSGSIVISGTPSEAGQVLLDVYVSDQSGTTVEVQRAFWIKTDPSLSLTTSLNPSLEGQPVTFSLGSTATVADWPAPWGQVTFKADGMVIPGCDGLWLEFNPSTEEPAPNPVTCTTSTLAVGSHTVTAELTALYGPYTSGSATLQGGQTVNADVAVYQTVGFTAPVDLSGVLNTAKAGQMIPLKWRLLDAAGNPVTDLDPASVVLIVSAYACQAGIPTDAIETYTSGTTLLQNLGNGYYQLNWKTEKSYANTCKKIILKIGNWTGDGLTALFQFR